MFEVEMSNMIGPRSISTPNDLYTMVIVKTEEVKEIKYTLNERA